VNDHITDRARRVMKRKRNEETIKSVGQSFNWCFTLNNYTDEEMEQIKNLAPSGIIQYIAFGEEIGEEGTPHLQGYLRLNKKGA